MQRGRSTRGGLFFNRPNGRDKRGNSMHSRLVNRLLAKVYTLFPSLGESYGNRLAPGEGIVPWTEPKKPLSGALVALVTTGGVHLRSQKPFDMKDPDGDPSWRPIPAGTSPAGLAITHDYYDHADAEKDLNLVPPLSSLKKIGTTTKEGALPSVSRSAGRTNMSSQS